MPNILVVEDDAQLRKVLTNKLDELGFTHEAAGTGREALRKLCDATSRGEIYDCMLLDIVMPEIDGWQVLEAVKKNPLWSPMKVVVLTGYANTPSDVSKVANYDGVHIEKKGHFIEIVGELLDRLLSVE